MREAFARMCRRIGTGDTRPGSISTAHPLPPATHYVRTEVALGWGYPAPLVISRAVSRFDLERHALARIEMSAAGAKPDAAFETALETAPGAGHG